MLPRLLVLITAVSTAGAALAAPSSAAVLFDRTSLAPAEGTPGGRDKRALVVQEIPPRVGAQSFGLPLAWSAEGERVDLQATLTEEIRMACEGLDAPARIAARLDFRATQAGETLPLLEATELRRLLTLEQRGAQGAGLLRTAMVRVLTRGNVRDRWSVRPEIASPKPETPPIELPASRLLQVDLVSFGYHASSDDASFPERFAHVGLRARLWNLREGRREWDRALLVGTLVPDDGDRGGAFRARAEELLDHASDLLAAALWPELELSFDVAALPEAGPVVPTLQSTKEATNEPPAGAAQAEPGPDASRGQDALLRRLAETRLTSVPEGDAWQVLARAVRGDLSPSLGIALACAEDPVGAAVQTGSVRLGLGLAETYRRVEHSAAFRKALATDLLDQVVESAGEDWPLERAVRYLLSDLLEQPAPGRDAPSVAGPLLQRARLDGARSPEGLASLLIGARIWPEGALALLEDLVSS